MTKLYHVSNWTALAVAKPGDKFTLRPGPQCAEGPGVYFSEGVPRLTAAEGAGREGLSAIVEIKCDNTDGWWRSKSCKSRKFGKPRTYHSYGKEITITVVSVHYEFGCPVLVCDWEFK
jgi:hypothetical protein